MTDLLQRAVHHLETLPDDEQDAVARDMLGSLPNETRTDGEEPESMASVILNAPPGTLTKAEIDARLRAFCVTSGTTNGSRF